PGYGGRGWRSLIRLVGVVAGLPSIGGVAVVVSGCRLARVPRLVISELTATIDRIKVVVVRWGMARNTTAATQEQKRKRHQSRTEKTQHAAVGSRDFVLPANRHLGVERSPQLLDRRASDIVVPHCVR